MAKGLTKPIVDLSKATHTVATLTMIVEYDEVPSKSELEELIDSARQYGTVVKADFSILKPVTTSLIREGGP